MSPTQADYSSLIHTYLRKFQQDPSSRVFAPLAEAYRKAGMTDEAIDVAREGLQVHPHFVGGKVALARALFDKQNYPEVIEVLRSVIQDAPDNIVAQRLMADSSLMLGQVAEALSSYKMLLYFAPGDSDTAQLVQELEASSYQKGTLVLRTDPPPEIHNFQEKTAPNALNEDPNLKRQQWISQVEKLQQLLLKVERYRHSNHPHS